MSKPPTVIDLLADVPASVTEEEFTRILERPGFRIERIVSTGHVTPRDDWYDQDDDEWVLVLKGQARLSLLEPDEIVELAPGQAVLIAAHRKHKVVWTSTSEATVWLAVHMDQTEK